MAPSLRMQASPKSIDKSLKVGEPAYGGCVALSQGHLVIRLDSLLGKGVVCVKLPGSTVEWGGADDTLPLRCPVGLRCMCEKWQLSILILRMTEQVYLFCVRPTDLGADSRTPRDAVWVVSVPRRHDMENARLPNNASCHHTELFEANGYTRRSMHRRLSCPHSSHTLRAR